MMSSMNESLAGIFGGGGTSAGPGGGGGDSSFDYRSLLPTRSNDGSMGGGSPGGGTSPPTSPTSLDGGGDDDLCSFFPEMTWRERLLGCATCMVAGYLLSFGSFFRIKDLLLGNPLPFVLNATMGNVISLAGSLFLKGPRTQINQMWHPTRRHATGVYLGSLALTLLVAFTNLFPGRGFLLVLLMLCQYVAITWYCLSYIPFAREAVLSYIQRRMAAGGEY